jgi:hypothetical protein
MDRGPKVSLEDLLKLKRAERPSPEFWEHFDCELRSKQLAALVQTKPWWQTLASKKVLIRVCMPLGAAAAVAMSFGSFGRVASRAPAARTASFVPSVETVSAAAPAQVGSPRAAATMTVASAIPAATPRVEESVPVTTVADVKAQDAAGQVWASSTATVKAAGQALAQLAGISDVKLSDPESEQTKLIEPLAQVSTPKDNRRSRLLAYSVTYDPHAPTSAASARSRESITHRMSDDSVYDSISRLGVSGNRVSIKF